MVRDAHRKSPPELTSMRFEVDWRVRSIYNYCVKTISSRYVFCKETKARRSSIKIYVWDDLADRLNMASSGEQQLTCLEANYPFLILLAPVAGQLGTFCRTGYAYATSENLLPTRTWFDDATTKDMRII